jgi:hypothetical protein
MELNSTYLITAIFGKTRKDAENFLLKLADEMKFGDIKSFNKFRMELILKDGSRYIAFLANDCSRGYKFKKAYVQRGIDKEFIYTRVVAGFYDKEDIEYFD